MVRHVVRQSPSEYINEERIEFLMIHFILKKSKKLPSLRFFAHFQSSSLLFA